jgi:hypothetical protein
MGGFARKRPNAPREEGGQAEAQDLIAHHWIEAYKRYIGPTPRSTRAHQYGG